MFLIGTNYGIIKLVGYIKINIINIMIKKHFLSLLIAFCILPLAFASAITMREGQNINLLQGETINDSVFLAGNTIIINSDINGDVFAFGQKLSINGNVDGDIIGAAQSITINGNVTGSVRVASQSVEIKGRVERSVSVAGQDILLPESSFVGRDALLAGETINISGTVGGSVNAATMTLNINGKVNKDINFYSNTGADANTGLFLTPNAVVSGDINYTAFGDVKGASQTNVLGTITKTLPQVKQKETVKTQMIFKLGFLISLLLTVLIIVLAGGKKVKDAEKIMATNVWKVLAIGFATLICMPILGIIFFVTGFGTFIGFVIIIAWVLLMLLAQPLAMIVFGQYLAKVFTKKEVKQRFLVNSLIGAIVGYILLIIPFVGFFAGLFGFCWGIGGMFLGFLESRKELV